MITAKHWATVLLIVGLVVGSAIVASGEPTGALTPEQRQELQKQITAKEKEAGTAENAEEFDKARAVRQEVLDLVTRRFGAADWRVTDARLALAHVDGLEKLEAAQREQLRDAAQQFGRGRQLLRDGKPAEAKPLLEDALTLRTKVLGDAHRDVALSRNELASALIAQGKQAEAAPLLRKALAVYQKVLGDEHPETAALYDRVAESLNHEGRYTEAEPLYRKAFAIAKQTLGDEDPSTATFCNHLATSLNGLGKSAEAEVLLRTGLPIWQKALGEEHPQTEHGSNNLAAILHTLGKYTEAEPLYRKVLALRRKKLGEESQGTAACYNNLATNLNAEGKYAEAEPLYRKALAINQKVLGEYHGDTANSYQSLTLNLQAQGKYAEAEPLQRTSLALCRSALGEEHLRTGVYYGNLALNLSAQGKYDEAEKLCRTALAICQKKNGEEHPDTAAAYNAVALVLTAQGKYADAEPLYRQALAINEEVRGDEHPGTANSYINLAYNLNAQGKHTEADPLCGKALAICPAALGEQHPDTTRGHHNLAVSLTAQGKYTEAQEAAQRAATSFQQARARGSFAGLDRTTIPSEPSPLPLLATLLARNGRPTEAWRWCEQNLASGLLDDPGARHYRRLTDAERRTEDELRGRLDQIDKQLVAWTGLRNLTRQQEAQRLKLLRQLSEWQGEWAKLQAELEQKHGPAAGQVYDLQRIQKQLPAHAALLAWLDTSSAADPKGAHWACLLHSTGSPTWIQLSGSGRHESWTADDIALPQLLREMLRQKTDAAAALRAARRLAARRLAPLEEHLSAGPDRPAITHLIVLPSEQMAGIPLELLTDRYSISYAPSGTMFAYLQEQRRPAAARLLALGDPTFVAREAQPAPRPAVPTQGVLVVGVQPASNAARAGIAGGDVLVRYAGTALGTVEDLKAAIARYEAAGQATLEVDVWRDGTALTVQVGPGLLGVMIGPQPLAEALRARYEGRDAVALSLRGTTFPPLPGTRREVEVLAGLFPEAKVLLGSDASAQQLDQLVRKEDFKDYGYIHLATHGQANTEHGLWSFLALANDHLPDPLAVPAPGQKLYRGQVRATDMLTWKPDADLVTLSACDTALGQKQDSEGHVAFAQALFLAGTRSVVLSQWKADDTATALLMQRFYQNLLGKRDGPEAPLGKAAALAEAKRWLRLLSREELQRLVNELPAGTRGSEVETTRPNAAAHPYEHPYYWAGFFLIGDPGDVSQAVPVLADSGPPVAVGSALLSGASRWWPWLVGAAIAVALGGLLFVWRRNSGLSPR
jgi:tetratricopeptide (TPR) repeat protein